MADVLSVIGAWLRRTWEFVLTYQDVSVWIGDGVIAVLGLAGRMLWRRHQRSLRPLASADEFPFEILPPLSEQVVRFVYQPVQEKDDPLDDFNIPYQQRQPGRCFLEQVEKRLKERYWVLLLGRTGLGKTREAAELAQRLNHEGWTILRLKNHVELEVPSRFEAERFGPQPRILFVLDNLNQLMALDSGSQSAVQENGKGLAQRRSTQERLLEVLEFYERALADRVRVVATARNERAPERNGLPSQWEMLGMERYPKFWGRFAQIDLGSPSPQAFENFLDSTAKIAKVSTENISTVVRQSDLNFRNAVENIWTLRNRQQLLSPETFSPTLRGTWQDHYNRVIAAYPMAKHLYDAIDLLKQVKVDLDQTIVLELARRLINPGVWQSWWIQWQLVRALTILAERERILQPRDGQIEAKGTVMSLKAGASQVINILITLAKTQETYYTQLFAASQAILQSDEDYQSAQLGFQLYLKQYPNSYLAWFFQGNVLSHLSNYKAAIATFDIALGIKPNFHYAFHCKGIALANLERYEDAIAAYDLALEIKPDDGYVLNSKGLALFNLGRYEAAVVYYDQALALAIKPDNYYALCFKGLALSNLGHCEEAIACYDQALAIKPDDHETLNNKGSVLGNLGRDEEAIAFFDQALAIKPDDYHALNNKGIALRNLGRYEETIAAFDQAISIQPTNPNPYYNKACCYGLQGNTDQVLIWLQKAIDLAPEEYREMAKTDRDFDAVRDDPRFQALLKD